MTRRRDLPRYLHPVKRPPSVRLEDAVLHEAAAGSGLADGLAVIANACQERRTSPARLRSSLELFPQLTRRDRRVAVLDDVASGAHSYLEITYLHRVERAHGLTSPDRQRQGISQGRRAWRDGDYPQFEITLELDGRLGHDWSSDRKKDRKRDLLIAGRGGVTLRQGCETAAYVVRVLWARGWRGQPVLCGTGCRLNEVLGLLEAG